MSDSITNRDDLQFPRTPGLLSGFDQVITNTDSTNLSVAGYSRQEVMQAILNLKESGLPGLTQTSIEKLVTHLADFNNPHQDDLTDFVSSYITTFLQNIVPGTVPDSYPLWAFNPDLNLDPVLLNCTCTRNSQLRVMTRGGVYKLIDVNTLATDWSTGIARVPCFDTYQLVNASLFPDGTTPFTVTSATVTAKDMSPYGIVLPDGTSTIHQLVATGDATPLTFSVSESVNSNQDYSFSFISYTLPTTNSQAVLISVPELSTDVVPVTFDSKNTYVCNVVGQLAAGYQIQLDGTVRWFCAFRTTATQTNATVTFNYPMVMGTTVTGSVPVSVDMIQFTNTPRPAPIVLPNETPASQTFSFAASEVTTATDVTFCINFQAPWLNKAQNPGSNLAANAVELARTPNMSVSIGSNGFWATSNSEFRQKVIGTPQETYSLVVSMSPTKLVLGLTGTSRTEYTIPAASAVGTMYVAFSNFNGYIIDASFYNVFDHLNATEFLTNG